MRRFLIAALLYNFCACIQAQFDYRALSIRGGYDFHNTAANHFNQLIDNFNNSRYPIAIDYNLGNLNFLRGYVLGADYQLDESLSITAVFRQRSQRIGTRFTDSGKHLGYLFRSSTLDLSIQSKIADEKRFSHYGGAGIVVGTLSAFFQYGDKTDIEGPKEMMNLDRSLTLGLSLHYEARFRLTKFAFLYLRPVVQYALPTQIRNLDAFLNPVETDSGIRFISTGKTRNNSGTLNGIGIDGGIVISPWHAGQ